jgi:hypothetical protein
MFEPVVQWVVQAPFYALPGLLLVAIIGLSVCFMFFLLVHRIGLLLLNFIQNTFDFTFPYFGERIRADIAASKLRADEQINRQRFTTVAGLLDRMFSPRQHQLSRNEREFLCAYFGTKVPGNPAEEISFLKICAAAHAKFEDEQFGNQSSRKKFM